MQRWSVGDLTTLARAVAEEFVDRIAEAERPTSGFADADLADALVEAAATTCIARLAATGCWGEANQAPSEELWRVAGPLLQNGWLQNRARTKPAGYAGDYEMLAAICEQRVTDHPLGRAFDRFFLAQAAPQAVRNRTQQTAAALAAHALASPAVPYRLASVGCGPALDVRGALALLPTERRRDVQVTLLDLDPAALECASRGLADVAAQAQVALVRENLFRLHLPAKAAVLAVPLDALVCSGLFDYLPDASAEVLLRHFWDCLSPGGLMLVGNFAPHNPTRAYMEWIGNWYLIYRTPAELGRLAHAAGIPPAQFHVGAERLGIDLFLSAVKGVAA